MTPSELRAMLAVRRGMWSGSREQWEAMSQKLIDAIPALLDRCEAAERCVDALRGMVGLVQLVQSRYPDFPIDNHRVLEAMSALNAIATLEGK